MKSHVGFIAIPSFSVDRKEPAHPYLKLARATGCNLFIFPLRETVFRSSVWPHITLKALQSWGRLSLIS